MERFAAGHLFFSYASKFREIENTLKIKGQGDRLEGGFTLAGKLTMQFHDEPSKVWTINRAKVLATYEGTENIPVFCLFSCFDKDCEEVATGSYKITLAEKIKEDINSHFKKADTAVIIHNPSAFIDDVNCAFNGTCKTELVNYFYLEGIPNDDSGYITDINYFNYLEHDIPLQKFAKGITRSFNVDYVYRVLLCKDVFFANEQEYRILLPQQNISSPREYDVEYRKTKTSIVPLSDIYSDNVIISR